MKYFIPEWDDRVDSEYDFASDTHSKVHNENPLKNDFYMWDIFGIDHVPFDGLIVSRMKIMDNKTKYEHILNEGIHGFLRLPKTFEIMGDCGAWGYIDEDEPPFKAEEVLDYYVSCGFNYGVSVDHMIVPAHAEQNERRLEITIDNAREMFELLQSKDKYLNSIRIIGAAQGWDVNSYRQSVRQLLKIGYDYIGLGGLARAPTGTENTSSQSKTVLNVVKSACIEISKWMKNDRRRVDLHVFGVARPQIMPSLARYGVTSFDSASFLRRAWLGASTNYYTFGGKGYAALRVRFQKEGSPFRPLEQESLSTIRSFVNNEVSKEEVIQTLEKYEMTMLHEEISQMLSNINFKSEKLTNKVQSVLKGNKMSNGEIERFVEELRLEKDVTRKVRLVLVRASAGILRIQNLRKHYDKTLSEKPWTKCDCVICKDIGPEVIIFRGNNRNRRRGFHNTWVFYQELSKTVPRILVFTNCTMKKKESSGSISAYQRYLASPPFKVFWNNVYDLPVEIKILSAKFGLIDWSMKIPNYNYKMQRKDVPKFVKELKEELKGYNKTFFIGLGLYREVAERIREEASFDFHVFPKMELTSRGKLDIIEYTKQMKFLRKAIVQALPEKCRPSKDDLTIPSQHSLEKFMK